MNRKIYCCGCGCAVDARLTYGSEIYPHRKDLVALPFWKCDVCGNSVGCHHKTKNPTEPLGVIATPEIKRARQHIHQILDPIWKSGRMKRGAIYAEIASRLGVKEYHTSNIKTLEYARKVYRAILDIERAAQ